MFAEQRMNRFRNHTRAMLPCVAMKSSRRIVRWLRRRQKPARGVVWIAASAIPCEFRSGWKSGVDRPRLVHLIISDRVRLLVCVLI